MDGFFTPKLDAQIHVNFLQWKRWQTQNLYIAASTLSYYVVQLDDGCQRNTFMLLNKVVLSLLYPLPHNELFKKWRFSTELNYGECAAYGGSKCWNVSCVRVLFHSEAWWDSSRYLSTALENSSVVSSVWALLSQMWGWVRRGTLTTHSPKLLPVSRVQKGKNFFNGYEVLDYFMTAQLFTVMGSSLHKTRSRQANEPRELKAAQP